jgi:hypothetical protein
VASAVIARGIPRSTVDIEPAALDRILEKTRLA